jgi:hypothetical protein
MTGSCGMLIESRHHHLLKHTERSLHCIPWVNAALLVRPIVKPCMRSESARFLEEPHC